MKPLEARMPGRGQPLQGNVPELRLAHAAVSEKDDLSPVTLGELRDGGTVVIKHSLEWLAAFPLRVLGRHDMHAIQREHRLSVTRVLDP
jgi:hypothetical protein